MSSLETIFRGVLEISWRSSWLILVVLALRALLRGRLSARVVFWAWIAVAMRLLLPFAVPTTWSPFNFAPFDHRSSPAIGSVATTGVAIPAVTKVAPVANAQSSAPSLAAPALLKKPTPAQSIALLWGAGVIALLLARTCAHGRFVRALRRSRVALSPTQAALLAEATGFANSHRVAISVTEIVHAPALHGVLRPELLFPPSFIEKLTPRELQLVVAHELAHDRRRDLLAQLLIHSAAVLHWFNPLVWLAARAARHDCELACDESVLRRLNVAERESYGATLLKIISLTRCSAPPPLALGVVESKQQIRRRIQLIIAQPSSSLARTVVGCALFLVATGFSLTAEILAQPEPAVTAPGAEPARKVSTGPDPSQWKFTYDASTDRLDALFPNGVVAAVSDQTITVADVRREMKPLVPLLQREARDQEDFNLRLNRQQNIAIKELVGRLLYIKQFHATRPGEGTKSIDQSTIDNAVADRIRKQFDNDRTKLLAYLRTRGVSMRDFRHEIEEEIIFHYMLGQERKLNSNVESKKSKPDGAPGQMHLWMIQLTRTGDATDAMLLEKANLILARFKNGESFEALAREFSGDGRRSKGGDWGWMSPGDLQPVYGEKAFALKKGEVSAPILINEGCFLLYAEDRK